MLMTQGPNFNAKLLHLAPDWVLRSVVIDAQRHVLHTSSYAPPQVFL